MLDLAQNLYKYFSAESAEKILKHKKQFISLFTKEEDTSLISSKVGGYGYLPKKIAYPLNTDNQPLSLLAQINFSEMPKLKLFPEQGILAFYVDYFDDLMGLDFDSPTNQERFKVFYFPSITEKSYTESQQRTIFSPFEKIECYPVVEKEMKLYGALDESIPMNDIVEFTSLVGQPYYEFLEEEINNPELEDTVNEMITPTSSIGGYPFFTQSDPREYDQALADEFNELLFQLDSDDQNIMWGDCGVGNFFINREKLLEKDFSHVLFNWDCY